MEDLQHFYVVCCTSSMPNLQIKCSLCFLMKIWTKLVIMCFTLEHKTFPLKKTTEIYSLIWDGNKKSADTKLYPPLGWMEGYQTPQSEIRYRNFWRRCGPRIKRNTYHSFLHLKILNISIWVHEYLCVCLCTFTLYLYIPMCTCKCVTADGYVWWQV